MAEKTIVDKAGFAVGFGIAAAADAADAVKTAFDAAVTTVGDVLKNSPAKKTEKKAEPKKAAKRAPAKKTAIKKASAKKLAGKKTPPKKAPKKVAPPKKAAKKAVRNPAKQVARLRR